MNGTYGTRDSYSCCNNIRVFQITLLTKEQAKLHVSMFPWTRNSNGGICILVSCLVGNMPEEAKGDDKV